MGCLQSRTSFPERMEFAVLLLNEKEEQVGKGVLVVTTELLQLTKEDSDDTEPLQWELEYLRRFGYDDKYFSFEAGRRCTGGPGIFAVLTPKAGTLFKMVDHYINQTRQNPRPQKQQAASGGHSVARANYQGVTVGQRVPVPEDMDSDEAQGSDEDKRLAYAQLDLSGKTNFKFDKSSAKAKTSYADLDFDKMEEAAANGAKL
eukprot:m.113198 g.113198  ORF g.113198 m.113198 type:complete len:203 (+) comp13503_c0_seq11:815-1423(+)